MRQCYHLIAGSNIGGIAEIQEMLDFCFKHNITAESEIINIRTLMKHLKD